MYIRSPKTLIAPKTLIISHVKRALHWRLAWLRSRHDPELHHRYTIGWGFHGFCNKLLTPDPPSLPRQVPKSPHMISEVDALTLGWWHCPIITRRRYVTRTMPPVEDGFASSLLAWSFVALSHFCRLLSPRSLLLFWNRTPWVEDAVLHVNLHGLAGRLPACDSS